MKTVKSLLEVWGVPHVGAEHKHGRPGWVQVDCPFCGKGSGKYHLGISLTTKASSCWRCGKHNTALVLATITGRKITQVVEALDLTGQTPPERPEIGKLSPPAGVCDLTRGHLHYLRQRGLNPERVVQLWDVKGIANAARLAWRLYIPIYYHGRVVSWTTRSIKQNAKQRYISAGVKEEAVRHKEILYGADYAQHAVIVHEGPIDVWATGPGAVATCGTAFSEAQVAALSRYPVRVVCFDADMVAQARASALCRLLSPFPGVTHNVMLETGKDAAEANPAEIAELRATFLD